MSSSAGLLASSTVGSNGEVRKGDGLANVKGYAAVEVCREPESRTGRSIRFVADAAVRMT